MGAEQADRSDSCLRLTHVEPDCLDVFALRSRGTPCWLHMVRDRWPRLCDFSTRRLACDVVVHVFWYVTAQVICLWSTTDVQGPVTPTITEPQEESWKWPMKIESIIYARISRKWM